MKLLVMGDLLFKYAILLKDFPDISVGKEYTSMQETPIQFLGWEDPPEKG